MASPFAVFRKNQKILMVGLTVLAMIAFVVSDNLDLTGGGGGVQGDPIVVKSNFFSLHESQVRAALDNRDIVHRFVVQAVSVALEQQQLQQMRAQFPQIPQEQLGQFIPYDRIGQQAVGYANGRFGPVSERSVVESLVLADQAKKMGMQVSDNQVVGFIAQTVQGLLGGDQLNAIMRSMSSPNGGKITLQQLTEAFRTEMLAVNMRMIFAESPAMSTTPLDRWSAYQRKRARATAEVLPISTADIIKEGKIKDPSAAELQAFYDKYRFDEPLPGSPDPGFKSPQKAQFQYVAADEAKFFAPDKITNEQIAAHYETNKSRYPYVPEDFTEIEPAKIEPAKKDEPKTDVKPEVKTDAPKTETPKTDAPKVEAPKTDAPKTEAPKADPVKTESPKTEAPKADAPKVEAPKPEVKKETPAAPAVKEETKKAEKVSPDCGADEEEASSCDNQADPAKTDAASASTPSATPSATPKATPVASPSATVAIPAATATATPSATSPAPTATATGTAAPAAAVTVLPPPPLPTEDLLLPDDVRFGRNPQYEPLWKVEKKIRDELARKAAADRVREIFDEIKPGLIDAALARDPAKPDVLIYDEKQWEAHFAKYPELVAKTSTLLTDSEVALAAEDPGLFKATVNGESFARAAFADSGVYVPKEAIEVPEFTVDRTDPEATTRYLWWKVKYEAAKVPELADIRDQVVFAWKTQQARADARKLAAELAEQAGQSPKSLAEQFPSRDVKLTNAFTWYEVDLSGGFNEQPTPTRVSRVDGVEDAGAEFMQEVFGLDVDEVGTAMNNPGTICYVIRLSSISPPRAQLYDSFMVDNFQTYQPFSQADGLKSGQEAYRALLADANLQWEREPRDRDR